MINLLIVDDHAVVRSGIRFVLEEFPDFGKIDEASSGNEAIKMLRNIEWDVVLLDVSMPGKDGLETLKQIKKESLGGAVIVFSMHPENQYAIRFLRAGASGYLSKQCGMDELAKAIRKAASGGKYITETLAESLASSVDPSEKVEPHEKLTDREYQVFYKLVSGKQVSEIARKLSLSVKTVSTHRCNILHKMKMKTNAEMMYYAISNGLVAMGEFNDSSENNTKNSAVN